MHIFKRNAIALAICHVFVVCVSCTKDSFSNLGSNHKMEVLTIKKDGFVSTLDTNEYKIKVEACLSMPEESVLLNCKRMKYDGGYYFLQSEGKNQTIWVFDSAGMFVSRLGERGRRINEYQTDITDWFHISGSNDIVVFEKNSRKIHLFSIDGRNSDSFILKSWPNAVGVLERGKLFCSYYQKEAKDGLQLALLSENEDVVSPLIFLGDDMKFTPSDLSFYKIEDRLFHVPNFADSAIVLSADTVEKIVKFNFEDNFISEEIKKDAYRDDLKKYHAFEGIKRIETYYETSEYDVIGFVYDKTLVNQLINKKDGRQYRFISALPKGLFPSTVFCVRENKIYYLFTKEAVEEIRWLLNTDTLEKALKSSSSLIRDIFSGDIPLPVIVSIEIK